MALSEYRFSARGVTGADTLVGQATATLAVKQDFFVDLKVPATLTQGDKPRFSAEVHHVGVKGPAEVRLAIYAGDREQVDPKTLDLKGDGVDAVRFDPFEVPDGESVRLTLTAKCGDKSDELVVEIPIRPWGVQAFASASGTSTDDVTTFVALPPGRTYDDPEMRIDLAPTLRRLLIDLALGHSSGPITRNEWLRMPVVPDTIADRASDLIAATAALAYLREARTPEAPEAARLTSRIQGVVAELISAQNDDGSWPWVTPRADLGRRLIGDRLASAHASVALASARSVGLLADPSGLEKATTYLAGEFARAGTDSEARAAILHALAASGKASFEQANALARSKQSLPDDALAYLALTLHHLDRASLAGEVLDVLATRAKSQPVGIGKKPLKYWDGADQGPFHRGAVETTALAALAFARVRPQATEFEAASEWLLAHRLGDGWTPRKAKGAAVAALAAYYGKAGSAEGRYRLVITVNDVEVHRSEVAGPAEAIAVAVPRKAIKLGAPNRVRFEIEGRGTFGYAVALTGFARDFRPEQRPDGKRFRIKERLYQPADPELDGRSLPTGFSVAINPTRFVNKVTQVAEGGRAKVQIVPESNLMVVGARDREFLVIEETLPAGATLIEGSVLTYASSYTLADGVLTFYFPPDSGPSAISYEIAGYLPGRYRVPPTRIRSAYDPSQIHLGEAGELTVLSPGEKSTDPYKATPDELYARGKALFGAGKLAEAAGPLEELAGSYTLNDATARDAARMLLAIHIKDYQPRKIVQDFEILREKGPDLIIPFDEVAVVGRAYRDIGEAERAYLVFRAIVEASYLEDAEVGEALRQRGRTLDATAYLLDLWRESPDTASIEADFFGLSQVVAAAATRSITDPTLRQELAEAGVTRSQLILQAIRMVQVVLAESPRSPLADEASLALLNAYLELEDFESVVKLAPRFAKLYPRSTFLDSFQYAEALGRFALGEYDRAVGIAEAIARASYKDANGLDQPSPNKWQALYILGQIHDARRDPAKAVEYYRQVADRFADAAGAVAALTRKGLTLPEVTIVRPGGVAPASIALGYRNVAEVDLRAYPVDLMRLYLTRRNLDDVAKIDLAGIRPTFEADLKLGDGLDFADKTRAADIPLNNKEGAYLVMARGGDLDASGILLVTPLELEVLEEADSGRVRVVVRDAVSKAFVPKVQVKVIGTANPTFVAGQTDLRGVFVAEGIQGQVTAVARKGTGQYAFYRGKAVVVAGRIRQATAPAQKADDAKKAESLDNNLKIQNSTNQDRQLDRLQNRFKSQQRGVNPF
jgi:tetratricopeptide (TPR) repeat protein